MIPMLTPLSFNNNNINNNNNSNNSNNSNNINNNNIIQGGGGDSQLAPNGVTTNPSSDPDQPMTPESLPPGRLCKAAVGPCKRFDFFEAKLIRSTTKQPLGLDVSHEEKTLKVHKVHEEGLVPEYNKMESSSFKWAKNDRIIEVNGVSGDPVLMLAE